MAVDLAPAHSAEMHGLEVSAEGADADTFRMRLILVVLRRPPPAWHDLIIIVSRKAQRADLLMWPILDAR